MAEAEQPKVEIPAEPAGEEPAAKKQKVEEAGTGDVAAAGGEGDQEMGEGVEAGGAAEGEEAGGPKKIGYKTFQTGSECYKYFNGLLTTCRKNQNLNDVSGRV